MPNRTVYTKKKTLQMNHFELKRKESKIEIIFQLGPWLAVEIPELIERGVVVHKDEKDS